ncbi:protein of unknown function [Methylorubrum extorquens DM4]|uniref:Uncharacterized protein n=1 Tax=Methylorubrum extorquens (strain DSM 6343 / CIP 106787 / DM4) TaxID=661410 RepID=C7CFC3_METED|nr:hypothetical protein [Methylorubrum extorquens]CAX26057.1 protein of unknown function [Methylorubrum extorquens DM4]
MSDHRDGDGLRKWHRMSPAERRRIEERIMAAERMRGVEGYARMYAGPGIGGLPPNEGVHGRAATRRRAHAARAAAKAGRP